MSMQRTISRSKLRSLVTSEKENHHWNVRRFKKAWRDKQIKKCGKLYTSRKKLTDFQKYIYLRIMNAPYKQRNYSEMYNKALEEVY